MVATPYCPSTEPKALLIVPGDSLINQLDDIQLGTYFQAAVRYLDNPDALVAENYNNPDYSRYFCQVHTKEWYDTTNQMNEAVRSAEELLVEVELLMSQYRDQLDENHATQIDTAYTQLKQLKNARDNYDAIIDAITDLNVLKQVYLDPLDVEPEEPVNGDNSGDTGDTGDSGDTGEG